jgi:hypothetical protein
MAQAFGVIHVLVAGEPPELPQQPDQGHGDRSCRCVRQRDRGRAEGYRLLPTNKLEPHGLPMTPLTDLTRQLHAVPGVRRYYLVRKQVERQPNKPLLILAFSCNAWWPVRSLRRADAIRKRIIIAALRFPDELLVLNLGECGSRLRMRPHRISDRLPARGAGSGSAPCVTFDIMVAWPLRRWREHLHDLQEEFFLLLLPKRHRHSGSV